MPTDTKLLLSPDEACERLSISRANLYKMLATKEIVSVKVGKLRRVPLAALEAWIERQIAAAGSEPDA